jgi:hypothetical protein
MIEEIHDLDLSPAILHGIGYHIVFSEKRMS